MDHERTAEGQRRDTAKVAAGNQNIAGRDVAVGQADSTAEKVWGCAKRIWSVLARLFGAKL